MKKIIYSSLVTMFLLLGSQDIYSQLYVYTNNIDGYANYVDPNLTADKLRRRKGAHGTGDECPIGFTSKSFATEEVFADDLSSVVLKITPNPGVSVNVEKFSANLRITDGGPIYVRFAYSIDSGSTWVDAGFDFTPTIATCIDGSVTFSEWDCPDFTADDVLYIRLYGYSAVVTNGRLNITDLIVTGSLNMVDLDEDGYSEYIDCDDTNPDIHPGAEEICNDIDENCNGISDEVAVSIEPTGDIYICDGESVVLTGTAGYESYQWYKNGNPIPVFTNTYTAYNPGYYQLWASNGDCSALSAVQAVAVNEMPFANIFYPEGLDLCFDDSLKLKASYDELYAWQWYRNGLPIDGETDYKTPVSTEGDYYCTITTVFGCTRTTETVTVIASCKAGSQNNIGLGALLAYPNPANDQITLSMQTEDPSTNGILNIVGLNGQVVLNYPIMINNGTINEIINISEIPAGIYSARVTTDAKQYAVQFSVVK